MATSKLWSRLLCEIRTSKQCNHSGQNESFVPWHSELATWNEIRTTVLIVANIRTGHRGVIAL